MKDRVRVSSNCGVMNETHLRVRGEREQGRTSQRRERHTPHRGTGAAQNIAMDGHATGIDGDQKGWRRVDRVALAREPRDAVRAVGSNH